MESIRGNRPGSDHGLQEFLRVKGQVALLHASLLLVIWAWVNGLALWLVVQERMTWKTGLLLLLCCLSLAWAAVATSLLVAFQMCAVVRVQAIHSMQATPQQHRGVWTEHQRDVNH